MNNLREIDGIIKCLHLTYFDLSDSDVIDDIANEVFSGQTVTVYMAIKKN